MILPSGSLRWGDLCLAWLPGRLQDLSPEIFDQPVVEQLLRYTCIVIFIQSLATVPVAILKRHLQFRTLAIRTITGTVIGGALGVGLASSGWGVWSIVVMQLAKVTVETLVLLVAGHWRPRLVYEHDRAKEMFGFAGPIVGFSLWNFVNDEMPKVIIGTCLGPYAVGIYALARRPLEFATSVFLSPLTGMAMPAVARVQHHPEKIDAFFNNSIRIAILLGFPAFMGLVAIAPEAIPLIFGQQWSAGIMPVQILMFLGLVRTVDSICAGAALALGHSRLILKFNIAYTFLGGGLILIAAQFSIQAVMAAIVF